MTSWILIANGSEARIYNRSANRSGLQIVSEHQHPESRMKSADLISDRSGHYQSDSSSMGRGSYQEPTPPKEHEMERFAHELADTLDEGRMTRKFNRLVLVSPPHFSGLLTKQLHKEVKNLVSTNVGKDYTKVAENKLLEQLSPYL